MNLNMLNPQQRLAAETLEGPVLILAGAGSGKTRALTCRAANLIDHGVPAWQLLCLTFTNKAAREMRSRILQLVGDQAEEAWISTFHSTCARILRRDIEKLGYTRAFTIFDEHDRSAVVRDVLKSQNIDERYLPPKELVHLLSDAKNKLLSPDEWFARSARDRRSQVIHDAMVAYEEHLRKLNALDFDDLLLRTLQLLAEHPPVLEAYQRRFRYVMVDEYQDTNSAQYQFVQLLTRESRNLCVVGDDDQSIYGWRGADIRNILDFEKDYPDTTVIKLEQNYRSTRTILDAANAVIAHNVGRKDKRLWTEAETGEPIRIFCADNERGEAGWVVSRIKQLHQNGVPYQQIAVLYRSNAQSRVLEDMFASVAAVPYRVFGNTRFYERKEIREIVAYLRTLENPADDISLQRIINVPRRSIGDSTVQELLRHAREQGLSLYASLSDPPASLSARPRKCVTQFRELVEQLQELKGSLPLDAFVIRLLELTGLREMYEQENTEEARGRVENLDEFVSAVAEFSQLNPGADLTSFLEHIALVTDTDNLNQEDGYVTLMTLHSAKGLEFDVVFITGMEEGVFPHSRSMFSESQMEEERRLCYVGITRARKQLFLSRALQRMSLNSPAHNQPSQFLKEIPEELIHNESAVRDRVFGAMTPPAPRTSAQRILGAPNPLGIPGVRKGFTPSPARAFENRGLPQFAVGDRVIHRHFGEGRVVEITGVGSGARIKIEFIALGVKEFMLSVAPIAKLEENT